LPPTSIPQLDQRGSEPFGNCYGPEADTSSQATLFGSDHVLTRPWRFGTGLPLPEDPVKFGLVVVKAQGYGM
jgi:hypothetical protein